MTGEGALLAVEHLSSWYGEAQVLWDVSLTVGAGEGVGIVGRNGAGKSTLLRTIAAIHRRAEGSARFLGHDILGRPPHQVARLGLSIVREGAPVFAELSVIENIRLGQHLARLRNVEPVDLDELWTIFPALEAMSGRQAGQLSGGQRQMLALATALASAPKLLLLDEPSAGLAPEAAATAFEAIEHLRRTGLSVLIAEQNLEWLAGVATRHLELESGRTVAPARSGS